MSDERKPNRNRGRALTDKHKRHISDGIQRARLLREINAQRAQEEQQNP
jgi:hypothetical protein